VPVKLGQGADSVVVRPSSSLRLILPNEVETESFIREITIYSQMEGGDPLLAPVYADQALGELSLTYNGETYGPFTLVVDCGYPLIKNRIYESKNQGTWIRYG
jgi:hypothetical protein